MRQCDIIKLLFRDLKDASSELILKDYNNLFESEMKEYFPFSEEILGWLKELYTSEKYNELQGRDRSILLEKAHPFLFVRDLASMNAWQQGFMSDERKDHISGLLFSQTPSLALEATLCLCRMTHQDLKQSSWFDINQAMKNLEYSPNDSHELKAWKGCAYLYLYLALTDSDHLPDRQEVEQLLEPFMESIEYCRRHGSYNLHKQCKIVCNMVRPHRYDTLEDLVTG